MGSLTVEDTRFVEWMRIRSILHRVNKETSGAHVDKELVIEPKANNFNATGLVVVSKKIFGIN